MNEPALPVCVKMAPVVAPAWSARLPGGPNATVKCSQYPASLSGEPRKSGTTKSLVLARAATLPKANVAANTAPGRNDTSFVAFSDCRCFHREHMLRAAHPVVVFSKSSPRPLPARCQKLSAACGTKHRKAAQATASGSSGQRQPSGAPVSDSAYRRRNQETAPCRDWRLRSDVFRRGVGCAFVSASQSRKNSGGSLRPPRCQSRQSVSATRLSSR